LQKYWLGVKAYKAAMNSIKKRTVLSVFIVYGGLLLVLGASYRLVFSHDFYLWQLSRSLAAADHPSQTRHIAFAKDIGLLVGNSNHCDYFVGELRSYEEQSKKEIEAFYKDAFIWNPLNRRKEHISIGFVENGKISSNADWLGAPEFLKDHFTPYLRRTKNQKLYFIFFLDVGNEVGCDVRCV
jgi:hypothetical protein